jgi:hypothetical protein
MDLSYRPRRGPRPGKPGLRGRRTGPCAACSMGPAAAPDRRGARRRDARVTGVSLAFTLRRSARIRRSESGLHDPQETNCAEICVRDYEASYCARKVNRTARDLQCPQPARCDFRSYKIDLLNNVNPRMGQWARICHFRFVNQRRRPRGQRPRDRESGTAGGVASIVRHPTAVVELNRH